MPTLNGHLYYACIQTPKKKYESEEKEYGVDVLVSKSVAKEWNKEFKKQKAKVLSAEEFTKIYKSEPPVESDDDEYYIIKLKRDAKYADGTPIKEEHKPKVFIKNARGKLENVTTTTLVGNGSEGAVSYRITPPNEYGVFAKLDTGIRVDKLVRYEGANDPTGGLGELEDGAGELGEVEDAPAPKPAAKKVEKAVKKAVASTADDEADPFN